MQAINHNGLILHSVTWLAIGECCLIVMPILIVPMFLLGT